MANRAVGRMVCLFASRGQALVETALVLPILLFVAFAVNGVGRVTQAQMGVSAVAREAARAGALANDPATALSLALSRGQAVGNGYGLTDGSLQVSVDVGQFGPGGQVQASATYIVSVGDLPLLAWASVPVASRHTEMIDLYRSVWPAGSGS
jgi:Flp pilus assembly protein TadG